MAAGGVPLEQEAEAVSLRLLQAHGRLVVLD